MIQIQTLRDDRDRAVERLSVKHFDGAAVVDEILGIDARRRATQNELDTLQAEANVLARQVGELMKGGRKAEADDLKNKSAALKESTRRLNDELGALEQRQRDLLVQLPNLPSAQVPAGRTAADNVVEHSEGTVPALPAGALPHWELAARHGLIDFELGVKIAGAGFPVYTGKGARLQRALINFFLDNATAAGYTEYQPPVVVNEDSGFGTGQLPDKEGQMYHVGLDNLYLIPTAEVPLTNLFRDVIVKEEDLPVRLCAYTPCFRREAGSYGKDVRGLNRLHQFDKVEIVQVEHPDRSYATLEAMKGHVAGLLRKLELPFRILRLCGGDMSFASALTFDFEVYSAAQEKWLEVSSVSNFETFQSNRMKLRYRDAGGKNRLAHTLNGSALALPRIVAALLENNQDGTGVKIPPALQAYTGFDRIG